MLTTRQDDATLELVFQRPERRNALDRAMLRDLLDAVQAFARNVAARVLVIRGEGPAFSAGSDIHELRTLDEDGFASATALYQELARAFAQVRKPTIAAINGYALGGGLEIALMCDLRIASPRARLGLPDAQLGFSPSGGLTHHLPRLVGMGWTKHLLLTGDMLDAETAFSIGLVTQVATDSARAARELAKRLASYPEGGIARTLDLLDGSELTFEARLERETTLDHRSFADPETQARLKRRLRKPDA